MITKEMLRELKDGANAGLTRTGLSGGDGAVTTSDDKHRYLAEMNSKAIRFFSDKKNLNREAVIGWFAGGIDHSFIEGVTQAIGALEVARQNGSVKLSKADALIWHRAVTILREKFGVTE